MVSDDHFTSYSKCRLSYAIYLGQLEFYFKGIFLQSVVCQIYYCIKSALSYNEEVQCPDVKSHWATCQI